MKKYMYVKTGELEVKGKAGTKGKVDLLRQVLVPNSKYQPHQGKQEKARRLRNAQPK